MITNVDHTALVRRHNILTMYDDRRCSPLDNVNGHIVRSTEGQDFRFASPGG